MDIMHRLYFLFIVLLLASCCTNKPNKIDASVDLEKFSETLVKYGYKPCDNFDNCFNGKFIKNIKFEALHEGLVVTFPPYNKSKRLDAIKEISTLEMLLGIGSSFQISKMCKKSINSWVYRIVADKCLPI